MITEGYYALIDTYSDREELVAVSLSVPEFVKSKIDDSSGRIYHTRYLAPEYSNVKDLKNGKMTWKRFEGIYRKKINRSMSAQVDIEWLLEDSEKGLTLRLLCWEKAEDKKCHRFTLLDMLKERGARIG